MYNRRLISYVLFVVGVLFILAALFLNVGAIEGLRGVLLGLVLLAGGTIFYRRAERTD